MKKKVYKNDGSIPVADILCTTYQMRNFYHQFRDGFFQDIDVMNYIQHLKAVRMMKDGDIVLDVCCGRGLLLPLMRYNAKGIGKYIGVDIEPKNMESRIRNICNGKEIDPKEHYPFPTEWIESNAASMADKIQDRPTFIVYTSSIEHMNKEDGEQSIREIAKIAAPKATLFLSCPNTPEGADGFDTQYKAHLYEWKISELERALWGSDFVIKKRIGLAGSISDFKKILANLPAPIRSFWDPIIDYLPGEFLKPILFVPIPQMAKEVLMICEYQGAR